MSKAKKVIRGLLEGGAEVITDSARQLAGIASPPKLLEHVLGQPKSKKNEVTEYIQNLSGKSPEEIKKKEKELEEKQQKELEDVRKELKQTTTPVHMRTRKRKEPSIYEKGIEEEERKKALAVETQKKQKAQSAFPPSGKQQRGSFLAKKKRPKAADFEVGKNIKIG